jgi:hypothetical protein
MAVYQWGTVPGALSNATPAPLGPAAAGTAIESSRSDHVHNHGDQSGGSLHAVATTTVAGFLSGSDKTKLDGVTAGATNTPLSNAAPADVGTSAAGSSTSASRADHVHAHGNQSGGALHAVASTTVAGFLSGADKTKLDGLAAIASSGSAADLSTGVIPDARMPDLTGDITTSEGAVATTIGNNVVTNPKLADMATSRIKGRLTAGTGDPEDLTAADVRTLLSLANIATSGDANDLEQGIIPDERMPNLTGDVTTSEGAVATTIANNAVSNAKLADMATARFKGRTSAGTGDPEDLTGTQATAMLDAFGSTTKGLAPASGGGTVNFLRADGTWTSGPVTLVSLSADVSSTSTTGAEVTGLQAASLATGTYVFQYFLRCQSAATTTGFKFGVNFTGTNSVFVVTMRHISTGTTSGVTGITDGANTAAQLVEGYSARAESTTAPNLGPTLGVDSTSSDVVYVIEGILVATGTGDLELWHASEVAGSSATVKAGSSLIVSKTG